MGAGILLLGLGLGLIAIAIVPEIGVPLAIVGFIVVVLGASASSTNPQAGGRAPIIALDAPVPAPPANPGGFHMAVQLDAEPLIAPHTRRVRRCRYCQSVSSEAVDRCPRCGASF